VVSESTNGSGVEWSGESANPAALIAAAFPHESASAELSALERIADALESIAGTKKCYGETDGTTCAIPPDHVGHHVSADGRLHWLDKE
jgi:uncharacterized membrane protein